MKFNIFNNANVLIKPEFDASKKQVLAKNAFITGNNKVKLMMAAEQYIEFDEFKPQQFGQFSEAQSAIITK